MNKEKDPLDFLLQRHVRRSIVPSLASRPWLVVYESFRDELQNGAIYCALLTPDAASRALQHPTWDLRIGEGMPGCSVRYEGDQEIVEYHRFGCDDGVEPLVLYRDYHGLRDSHPEITEEFRLFHNAYWDHANGRLYKFSEDGSEEVIGRLQGRRLELRLREVRQFLAIKGMCLAIYVDIVRFSDVDPSAIPNDEREVEIQDERLRLSFHASPCDTITREHRSFSRLLGKVLLPPPPPEDSDVWPYDKSAESYPEFIIAVDETGRPVTYSCNPDGLANYFGANPHAPHYLTPVFFRRNVLSKYYSNPQKYSVEDGYLRCAGLWGLRIDNNASDYVIVFLGDLGRDLPEKERLYWRAFNVPPDGSISSVCFRRGFLAEFADPESPDLLFKYVLDRLMRRWRRNFGWDLFLPLSQEDSHHFDTLRVPLTDDQAEFDAQVLNLTKVLVDSLNEAKLEQEIESAGGLRGISRLERFLEKYTIPDQQQHIGFLRDLQALRSSGVAHRKGTKYDHVKIRFKIGELSLIDAFREILGQAIAFVEALGTIVDNEGSASR